MTLSSRLVLLCMALAAATVVAADDADPNRDILVTFQNTGASALGGGIRAPYRARKRYSIAPAARRDARAIAEEFQLTEIDHWPIRSLTIYCFVYRVADGADRTQVIARLRADRRVESAQELQEFETRSDVAATYDDPYAELQPALYLLGIAEAHRYTRGSDIRVALVDSNADTSHEDLKGRIRSIRNFSAADQQQENRHGTAVASIIGAIANNGKGIVGIAPEASLDLLVACWAADGRVGAVCNSFTLAKALDSVLDDPPDILNMSLTGPDDTLLRRLLLAIVDAGVVVVAAEPVNVTNGAAFPADLQQVVSVSPIRPHKSSDGSGIGTIYAPGDQVMVAVPGNAYDFRSGSSLAAAHVSGVVALLLSVAPALGPADVQSILMDAQVSTLNGMTAVDACRVLWLADSTTACQPISARLTDSELYSDAERQP